MEPLWFERFAAIPGVDYRSLVGLDASRLPGYGTHPRVHRYPIGDLPPSLMWGQSSAAPAREHVLQDLRKASTASLLANIAEVLELPGAPSDYHYALQAAAGELRRRRREDRSVFAELERLCLLDLQLLQAVPPPSWQMELGDERPIYIVTLDLLLEIYLQEGLLSDALRVASLAMRLGNGDLPRVAQALERAASGAAEDTGP